MQIHLFDCKSTDPLRRGLGTNKLNLCMLVLSQLRNTYWSASVTYRLFARAQALLDKYNSGVSALAEKPNISPQHLRAQSHNQDILTEQNHRHQGQQRPQLHQDHPQQQGDTGDSMRLMQDTNLQMNEQTAPFWMDNSPSFSNVDQLLSPGFTIPENAFHSFFASYDNGMGVYGQSMPVPGNIPIDLLYHT
jgi:hypothetical protein